MAKTTAEPTGEKITLEILQKGLVQRLDASELNLVNPKLSMQRLLEYPDALLLSLRAGVLADHLEHKQATYTQVELPRWLKWLDRFTVKHERVLQLDAYHTYPLANVKMPQLGQGYTEFIKQDYEV